MRQSSPYGYTFLITLLGEAKCSSSLPLKETLLIKRLGVLLTVVAAVLLACSGVVLAQSTESDSSSEKTSSDSTQNMQAYEKAKSLQLGSPGSGQPGPLSAAQKRTMAQGYLVPDQAAYEKAKAEANAKAEKQLSSENPSSIDTAAL